MNSGVISRISPLASPSLVAKPWLGLLICNMGVIMSLVIFKNKLALAHSSINGNNQEYRLTSPCFIMQSN